MPIHELMVMYGYSSSGAAPAVPQGTKKPKKKKRSSSKKNKNEKKAIIYFFKFTNCPQLLHHL